MNVFPEMRSAFATIYPDSTSAKRVAEDAGLDTRRIHLESSPLNNWHGILAEAIKVKKVDQLLHIAFQEYPDNDSLRNVRRDYWQLGRSQNNKYTLIIPEVDEHKHDESEAINAKRMGVTTFLPPRYVQCPRCGVRLLMPKLERNWDFKEWLDPSDYADIWSETAKQLDVGWHTRGMMVCTRCGAQHKLVTHEIATYLDNNFECPKCRQTKHLETNIQWNRMDDKFTYRFIAKIMCSYCQKATTRSKTLQRLQDVLSIIIGQKRARSRQR